MAQSRLLGTRLFGAITYEVEMNATPDRLGEVEQAAAQAIEQAQQQAIAAASEFEGEVREFVRRDVSFRQRVRPSQPATESAAAADSVNGLIQKVAGASTEEIERVIAELQALRDQLRGEAERVQREISNYAGMSQAAMSSMQVIGDSLRQLKAAPPQIRHEAG
jgi:vacuolar-type H+-ATPase subunit I/STV1